MNKPTNEKECNMFGCDHSNDLIECEECHFLYCDDCFDEHYLGAHS